MGSGTKLPVWICMVWLIAGLASGGEEVLRCFECNNADTTCGSPGNSLGYVRECPNSTMCSTIVMSHSMGQGKEWTRTKRGCSEQVQIYQVYVEKDWVKKYRINELKEGCTKADRIIQCNCHGSMCNSAVRGLSKSPPLLILLALVCGNIILPV
ncbi:hypothetical protein KR084_008398 [Drosophila pseudotakahashii]|nr:hypothetical protein KR084_008398 [Drosophila pseudotakahashii]